MCNRLHNPKGLHRQELKQKEAGVVERVGTGGARPGKAGHPECATGCTRPTGCRGQGLDYSDC
jgi:hypothetical protein